KLIRHSNADIIVITGDLVDRDKPQDEDSFQFIDLAIKEAPVYYIAGNHEWQSERFIDYLKPKLTASGVRVLSDSYTRIIRGKDEISLVGVEDYTGFDAGERGETDCMDRLNNAMGNVPAGDFKILLSHRPEMISLYKTTGVDVVFSGHTHGGQIKLPFVGAIFAPDQGLFPKYGDGRFKVGNTTLIVSRGLGRSVVPVRILCKPQLIVLTLHSSR
ncbi:MAG: metallophosphoesterase, partial [Rubrobacteridae bacterium]|nr:metallophosphoesterase [Rubrobacteridae bacterium]